ncbi:MAG: glycosyltransferase, partial [Limisphaerales bacterium]
MLTYNHERYLAQAIESVLEQKTGFDVELLIADDCSKDRTAEIARSYQKRFSNILYLRSDRNRGMYQNLAKIYYRARGEYLAFLEGDDFWLSPDKLKMQVDHLDANPAVSLCFHAVRLVENGTFTGDTFPKLPRGNVTFEKLLVENWVPTCSAVFRQSALPAIPSWCSEVPLLDWPLFLLMAEKGRVRYLPGELSAYRLHSSGVWSQLPRQRKSELMIQVLQTIKQHLPAEYIQRINQRISELYQHIAWCCEEQDAIDEALAASWRAVATSSFTRIDPATRCLRLALKASSPRWLGNA